MSESKHTRQELAELQALPLSLKVRLTQQRIREWVSHYGVDGVAVSFSGGKDSTVLLHIVREMYPSIPGVFCDTGLEYPEIRSFVRTFDNIVWLKPKKNFRQVITEYGYPFISKEVSECVYGARKYLTEVLAEIVPVDRQTDRQTDRYHTAIGTTELLEQEHIRNLRQGTRHKYQYETERVLGFCRPEIRQQIIEGGGTTTSIVNSEELANTLNRDKGKRQVVKTAILMGMLTKDNQIKANIPDKDRSMFSQAKYKFMLDSPFEISNRCCSVMKKEPFHRYAKQNKVVFITAQMASESRLRTQKWLQNGCNGFDLRNPISNPMSFWTEQDVLLYIYQNKIPIASVYGEVVKEVEVDGQLDFEDLGIFELGRPTLKTTGCKRTG